MICRELRILFAFACILVSCTQELPLDLEEGRQIQLRVNDTEWTADEAARTAYTEGSGVAISGTEMISLLYEKDRLYKPDIKAVPTAQRGIYSFTMPSGAEDASRWYGIMPYSKWLTGVTSTGNSVTLRLGPVQFPEENSFDPHCDYLISKPFAVNGSTAEIRAFKRLFAPLCLSINGLPEGSKIYTLTMSLSQAPTKYVSLTGLYYLSPSEKYDDTVITNVDQKSMGNAVSAEYGEGLPEKDGSWPVWLMVNPITLKAGWSLTVSLSTQDRTYTRTVVLPSSQTLETDRLNKISFNIKGSGYNSRLSLTQDFANQTLGGTKVLNASNGSELEWVTTTTREYRSSDDGGSGIKGALMLNGTSFTFPEIEGFDIVGARVFTHPSSRSRADLDVALTVDGTDVYPFNLANDTASESLAWKGGVVNIGLPAGKTSLSGLVVTTPANQHLISAITLFLAYEKYDPTPEDLKVDRTLFELLDLDYPSLGTVRYLYESGRYKMAADELLAYFKNRPDIVNPAVTLPVTTLSASEQKIARDALPENDYRFAIHAGMYYESYSGGEYTYYSFSDGQGGINWEYEMPLAGTQVYQKHWHAWFQQLGQMFSYTGDEKWFEAWKAQYTDWMAHYPVPSSPNQYTRKFGYNSWHALSMATRLENQAKLFEYFKSASGFDFTWLTTFLKAYRECMEYSRANLYYSETSNIRFAQYKSHCLAGILFPEFKEAASWLATASAQVSNYFDTAFNDDGCLIELDANYHSGEVMNFVTVYEAALKNDRLQHFNQDFLEKLRKSCTFLADYCYPDGSWETFNDSRLQTASVTRRWMGTLSALYPDDGKYLYLASGGTSGTKPKEYLCEYRTSGYYMFRSDWIQSGMMLIYKNNYNPDNMWHAHRDNGTVGFYKNGRRFLPSSGSYTYGDGEGGSLDKARAEHQAARNHNTLTCELSDIPTTNSLGRFLKSFSSSGNYCVVAENPSYEGLTHRRTVWMVKRNFFVIADAAYGSYSGKTLNLSWHLCRDSGSSGVDVVQYDDDSANLSYGAHTEFSDGNNLLLRTFSETGSGFSAQTGLSWCSEKFGERYQRKFYRVNVKKDSQSSVVRFITVLFPCKTPSSASVSASYKGAFSESGESLSVTVNGVTYNLSYSL